MGKIQNQIRQKMREEAMIFSAVMYWAPHRETDADMAREEFKKIKETGFDTVRLAPPEQILLPGEDYDLFWADTWLDVAVECGLKAILHAFEEPSPGVLQKLGISKKDAETLYADSPLYDKIMDEWVVPVAKRYSKHPGLLIWAGPGEPPTGQGRLQTDEDRQRFAAWLEEQYGTIEALDSAWNIYPAPDYKIASSFEDALRLLDGFDVDPTINGVHRAKLVYGAGRDLLRFLVDARIDKARKIVETVHEHDQEHPVFMGAHQLFANNPDSLWDNATLGQVGDGHGTSTHLSWHYEVVDGEIDRPVYIQSRMTSDALKEGLTACWEATGGPVQFSGGFGNHMSPGLMRRLCLSSIAAGNRGLGFWVWNSRPGGWEVGEYGMTALDGTVTDFAKAAGEVACELRKYARELWDADQPAQVGILHDWDTQAIYCFEPERAEREREYHRFVGGTRQLPNDAQIGIARALTNAGISFQFISTAELQESPETAQKFSSIFAPHLRALKAEVVKSLKSYAEQGGRVVADVSFALLDQWGKLHPTGPKGLNAGLFGDYINQIHDARTGAQSINNVNISGFFGDLKICEAEIIATFANGKPAVSEISIAKGSAVMLAFDPGTMCRKAGREDIEKLIAKFAVSDSISPVSSLPLSFRLPGKNADHIFLINDGPATDAEVNTGELYAKATNVLTAEEYPVKLKTPVFIPENDAIWLRLEKK